MCWNASVSIATFAFGTASAIFVTWKRKMLHPVVVMVYLYSCMQLVEFFAWTFIDDPAAMRALSIAGIALIVTQVAYMNWIADEAHRRGRMGLMVFFLVLYGVLVLPHTRLHMERGASGHLVWWWIDVPVWWCVVTVFGYFLPLVIMKDYVAVVGSAAALAFSMANWYSTHEFGSMWCFIANSLWIVMICTSFSSKKMTSLGLVECGASRV
jgi:hypothetical protein